MKKAFFRVFLILVLILPVFLTLLANKNQVKSVPVTNLKNQLSNAQLSFFGRVASYTGSVIKIDLSNNPSKITANLSTGDTIAVANVGVTTSTLYTVSNIGDTATIEISSAVGTTTPNAYIIATRSAIHTVSFIPQASVLGEKWQFLIKATNRSGEKPDDGIPDQIGFDIGSTIPGGPVIGIGTRLRAADISCPMGGVASVGSTVVITSGVSIGSTGVYHVIQCDIGASLSTPGVGISMVVGRPLTTGSQLINPSPDINHTPGLADGTADTHVYGIRQLDSASNILDTTFGKLAVTESVRVTAIVDPTITFAIGNSNSTSIGTTRCTSPIGAGAANTTPYSVSFGPLVLGTFNNLSQSLHCTTNSLNGYVIQVFENRPLTMLGAATTIPDTNCNATGCTTTAQRAWTTFTNSGFGYSLEVGVTSAGASIGITSPGHYKAFPVGGSNAQTILSRTNTPAGTDSIYICYRATASTAQQAGTYENSISFIATATF